MKDCDAVLFGRDMGSDYFMILKNGECIWENQRFFLLAGKKGRRFGSRVGVEVAKKGEEFPKGNLYFRVVEENVESGQQRFDNLVEGFRVYANNAYTTAIELNEKWGKVAGCPFCELLYFEMLAIYMSGFESFYRGERNWQGVKFVKAVRKEFDDNAIHTLGMSVANDRGSTDEFPLYVKRIRKQHFGLFTPTKKVVQGIHGFVRDDALAKLDKIIEFDKLQRRGSRESAEKN